MKYDITKNSAPKMPSLGNGTECIRLLLSQASKDMYNPLVPMFFPVLGAHMSGAEFQYPDLTWKEPCGQMANLVSDTGGNKGQLSLLVEAERALPPPYLLPAGQGDAGRIHGEHRENIGERQGTGTCPNEIKPGLKQQLIDYTSK